MRIRNTHNQRFVRGFLLLPVLVMGAVSGYVLAGISSWAVTDTKAARALIEREQAVQMAEAGVEYYRWHLAHAPLDFQDGTATSGSYTHVFEDKNGNPMGEFELSITPPPVGSTRVGVRSTGRRNASSSIERSISMGLAKPSMARFAVVSNSEMRFGEGTEVFGPVHSNGGVRFDGLAHNVVTSAVATYDDPDHTGANEFGVHTHLVPADPTPPASVPTRTDVFMAGRTFPVPAVDFAGITADLSVMKTDAQTNGFYRGSAGALGYHVVLRTDDTFDLYRATNLVNAPSNCTNTQNQSGWGTWSINNQHFIGNYPFPANGILFFEDDVFVDGQIDGARLTIVAAFFPDNPPFRKNIIVNNDLLYTRYDGTDSIGLIAQGNVTVGMVSDTNLRIDAALMAQNGRVGRYYYRPPGGGQNRCSPYHARTEIISYGMIASNQRYGFAYTDGTGYATRTITYDAELLYAPPPSFPLTSDQYEIISWKEE